MRSTGAVVLSFVLGNALAAASWAQSTASSPQTEARPASRVVKTAPSPQLLFGTLATSTRSAAARQQLELAIDRYENFQEADAILRAQNAAKIDPDFALAYAVWSFAAKDVGAAPEALRKAQVLSASARCMPDDKLMVKFMTGAQQSNLLPAIVAMNDLLKKHPKDKHVLYIAGEWLYSQQDYARGRALMEASLEQDPSFPPALNMLGYAYVGSMDPQPDKAISYLQRYADTLPGDPNPQDSLGEVLRMTWDDLGSLAHYQAALKISPTFLMSQCGLGDTYTLMGQYVQARTEYDKALAIATNDHERFHVEFQKALVHFWEGHPEAGRVELAQLSLKAAEAKDWLAVFEIDYARVLLVSNPQSASQLLAKMENQLVVVPQGMLPARRNTEYARVLREEVRLALVSHKVSDAEAFLQKLEQLATATRDPKMESIYESSRGYLASAKGDYAGAVDELSADLRSPLVVQQLIVAEQKRGNPGGVLKARTRLKYLRTPTAEWYSVTKGSADISQSGLKTSGAIP